MKAKNRRARKRPVKYDRTRFPRRLLTMILCALVTTLVVEAFNQASIPRLIEYLKQPQYFALNFLVILMCMSLSELFRHRRAMNASISALWMVLGIANHLVVRNRTLPLAGGDLLLDIELIKLGLVYFTWIQIISVFVGGIALIAGIAWLFTHTAVRRRINYAFSCCVVAMMILLVFGSHMMFIKAGALPDVFPDRVTAYKEYGFTTCFAFTFGRQGIDKPEEYSSETVVEILEEVDTGEPEPQPTPVPAAMRFTAEEIKKPNIIFLQLESFFDVNTMLDTELSGDPTPNFHELLEEWPSAKLFVPTVGGGTANVEFEVMSGMNMDFFGAGETPYNTIIQEGPCETIANTLREHGYTSTAMHNNTGTFFNRNEVYANLGYDRFDSLEYMLYPKYNRGGWAHDEVLISEIMRALETTDTQDMIFAIGVESHGKYGDTYISEPGNIEVLSAPEEIYLEPFQNYVNVIRPVDDFLVEILGKLERYHEPIVAVIYGDHLPGIGLTPEMVDDGDLYASKYIIWNNYGAEFEAKDMQSYRLGAELLRQLDLGGGVMYRFHQAYPVDETGNEYLEKLQILEYDMLYGDQETYGESGAPEPTQLHMGIEPVSVESAVVEYGRLMVTGENFTEYSAVVAGEEVLDTVFIDHEHIAVLVEPARLELLDVGVCVAQINGDGVELSRTENMDVEIMRATK